MKSPLSWAVKLLCYSEMLLAPLDCYGWSKNNGPLEIVWDTAENIQKN